MKDTQAVYRLGPVIYVPHYTIEGVYVGPGYARHDAREWSAAQLLAKGAIKEDYPLLDRARARKA